MIAMLVGTTLALAALAYVLYPLLRDTGGHGAMEIGSISHRDGVGEGSAVDALRDVEFDYATGKLSGADYQTLRALYLEPAARQLRGEGEFALPVCRNCGARLEPDALYCSNCGRALVTPAPHGSTF